jgi:beta-glucanase (GH16 family)
MTLAQPHKRALRLALAAVLVTGTATLVAPFPAQPAHATTYTFDDEFNGAAGTQPSTSLWKYDTGGYSTTELQCYTNSTNNIVEDGAGNLKIMAQSAPNNNCGGLTKQYTSGRLETSTTHTQKYGTFTMRAKLPTKKGMFPAFWMIGNQTATKGGVPCDGEIDIEETIGSDTGSKWVEEVLHGPYTSGGCPTSNYSDFAKWTGSSDWSSAYHTFSVTWAPGSLTYKVDGTTHYSITKATMPAGQNWVYDTDPFYLIMNLAVGGSWAGTPDAQTVFPQTMYVDWVHMTAS